MKLYAGESCINWSQAIEKSVFLNSNKADPVYKFLNDTFLKTSMADV